MITTGRYLPLLIVSDVHYDSPQCDKKSLKKNFDEIKEKGGKIIVVGDWFDVMGCDRDPRTKPADIDPKYYRKDKQYLDAVVEDSAEFLMNYRDEIMFMGYGNHETKIMERRDTDPLARIVSMLNMGGANVQIGAYAGWIKIRMKDGQKKSKSFNIRYHHGYGGGAKRSKGILNAQIDAMAHPDAHLIVSGHDHNKIYDPSNVRQRVTDTGKIYEDTIHWLKTGSYKMHKRTFGYETQGGMTYTRMGGWFVDLTMNRFRHGKTDVSYIDCQVMEAVPKTVF